MQNFMKTILSAVKTKIKDSTADWNQNDSNADSYVKNKTHYDSRVLKNYSIAFDGNIENKEIIQVDENVCLIKVSNDILGIADSGIITYYTPDGLESNSFSLKDGNVFYNENLCTINDVCFICCQEIEIDTVLLTPGIWFIGYIVENSLIAYVATIKGTFIISGELKTLDKKYLPEDYITETEFE